MSGHTPGPWKVSHDEHEPYWNIDMPMQDGSSGYGFCNAMVYTTEDDARLIAAAPELLDALRQAKTELIDLYEAAYPDDESDNDTTRVIDMVIKVLNKAEGKA